jgi:hypothetical protein
MPPNPDIESGLNDLRSVGPEKPVGYLPVNSLVSYFRSTPEVWIQFAIQHHLKVLFASHPKGIAPFMYLYHPSALETLLKKNAHILEAADWPTDPEEFIRRMTVEYAPIGTPLYDLIADAFGDKDNPCRSDRQ